LHALIGLGEIERGEGDQLSFDGLCASLRSATAVRSDARAHSVDEVLRQ
jgi:hypothetical protein